MFVSRDVIFHKEIFPFVTNKNKEGTHPIVNYQEQFCGIYDDDRLVLASRTSQHTPESTHNNSQNPVETSGAKTIQADPADPLASTSQDDSPQKTVAGP